MGGREAYQTISRRLLSRVMRIEARHPVLGPFPVDVQTLQEPADGFVTHLSRCHAPLEAHVRKQLERPGAPRLAKEPWTPVQEFPQLLVMLLRPDRLDPVRGGRLGRQASNALALEGMQDIADRLRTTAQVRSDLG